MGADGVQMGLRFLTTEESSATEEYKQAVSMLPMRISSLAHVRISFGPAIPGYKAVTMYVSCLSALRKPNATRDYVPSKGFGRKIQRMPGKVDNKDYFCICTDCSVPLVTTPKKRNPSITVGTNASRIDRLMSVKSLMDELTGKSS